jgi:hypothetical protein
MPELEISLGPYHRHLVLAFTDIMIAVGGVAETGLPTDFLRLVPLADIGGAPGTLLDSLHSDG